MIHVQILASKRIKLHTMFAYLHLFISFLITIDIMQGFPSGGREGKSISTVGALIMLDTVISSP